MKFTITCPDCGKTLEVDVSSDSTSTQARIMRREVEHLNLSDIIESIQDGDPTRYLSDGSEISIQLKDGTELVFYVIIGFYEKDQVIFVSKDLPFSPARMNHDNTNKGGWRDSEIRMMINSEIAAKLPDELLDAISPRRIVQDLHGKKSVSEDKLWLLSATEVFGDNYGKSDSHEDKRFPIFSDIRNGIKLDKDGVAYHWWLRSPYLEYSNTFCIAGSKFYLSSCGSTNSSGICFGFCINKKQDNLMEEIR